MAAPSISVSLACLRHSKKAKRVESDNRKFVIPGDIITKQLEEKYIISHGTYLDERADENYLRSSVAGVVEYVSKLVTVNPLKTRYNGEVGDVIIGRVVEVSQKRWKVDIKAKLDAFLPLSCVNLPAGEIRRKSEEDEKWMREYMKEGDVITAEVRSVYSDGVLSLNTKNLKHGKLGQGLLLSVSPSLIKHRKAHFHTLICNVGVILGSNGYIWVYPLGQGKQEESGGHVQNFEPFSKEDHELVSRVRNSILLLSEHDIMLYDNTIIVAYEASMQYQVKDLLKPDISREVADIVRHHLQQHHFMDE
ncbi:hypothetical protein HELRODRAFT_116445 [Helobdella robusta]|uniref:S1 motif domain-containing protein n=1 Tax=Helobdella robusta TaxID=6412 RepID=T1EGF1_HELRO|nr:hypothetical protein HELRODRAFT_116445 [Helobdella robusta]ESN90974.1 hypothetical protein HELRODRAFT_116445 [Helobdella robusta]